MISLIEALNFASILGNNNCLHKAVLQDDENEVVSVLENEPEIINALNCFGCTALRLAAEIGNLSIIEHLLRHGAEVNKADIKCRTPLFMAVKNKHLLCLGRLLTAGACPDGDSGNLCTPLYVAAMDGNPDVVQMLIRNGANLNLSRHSVGTFVSTPVYISVIYKHYNCFRHILVASLRRGVNIETETRPLYHTVVEYGCDLRFVRLLYGCGFDPGVRNKDGRMACEEPDEQNVNREKPETMHCVRFIRSVIGKPRKLVALSRIAVVKSQSNNQSDDLLIPEDLKKYLKFDYL